jgi:hypothetical protein
MIVYNVVVLFFLYDYTMFVQENIGVEKAGATVAAYLTHHS